MPQLIRLTGIQAEGRHGAADKERETLQTFVVDVEVVVRLVAAEHPGTPLFLAASSWAAKLAVVYAALRPAPLSGLLLLGPAGAAAPPLRCGFRCWSSKARTTR